MDLRIQQHARYYNKKMPRNSTNDKPTAFDDFTDASNIATSPVIYMRSTTTEENVIVNYVISKSRVAPKKHTSTFILELEAATMGA